MDKEDHAAVSAKLPRCLLLVRLAEAAARWVAKLPRSLLLAWLAEAAARWEAKLPHSLRLAAWLRALPPARLLSSGRKAYNMHPSACVQQLQHVTTRLGFSATWLARPYNGR